MKVNEDNSVTCTCGQTYDSAPEFITQGKIAGYMCEGKIDLLLVTCPKCFSTQGLQMPFYLTQLYAVRGSHG